MFLEGRLYFHHSSGKAAKHNSGAPSALVAYGSDNAQALVNCGLKGKLVFLKSKILVECRGGLVQTVLSSDPSIDGDILDWDDFNEGANVSQEEADKMYAEYQRVMPHDVSVPREIRESIK